MGWIYLRGGPADGRTLRGDAWGPVVYVHPDPAPVGAVEAADAAPPPHRYVKSLPEAGYFVLREDASYPAGTPTSKITIQHDVAVVYDYAG